MNIYRGPACLYSDSSDSEKEPEQQQQQAMNNSKSMPILIYQKTPRESGFYSKENDEIKNNNGNNNSDVIRIESTSPRPKTSPNSTIKTDNKKSRPQSSILESSLHNNNTNNEIYYDIGDDDNNNSNDTSIKSNINISPVRPSTHEKEEINVIQKSPIIEPETNSELQVDYIKSDIIEKDNNINNYDSSVHLPPLSLNNTSSNFNSTSKSSNKSPNPSSSIIIEDSRVNNTFSSSVTKLPSISPSTNKNNNNNNNNNVIIIRPKSKAQKRFISLLDEEELVCFYIIFIFYRIMKYFSNRYIKYYLAMKLQIIQTNIDVYQKYLHYIGMKNCILYYYFIIISN